jgi:hypothetical protein
MEGCPSLEKLFLGIVVFLFAASEGLRQFEGIGDVSL